MASLSEQQLDRALSVLNVALEQLEQWPGKDTSDPLDYEELAKVVRKPYPGLNISESMLSDEELRGVWKAMDTSGGRPSHVSIDDFVVFARSRMKPDTQDTQTSKDNETSLLSEEALTQDQLYVIRTLESALRSYFGRGRVLRRDGWETFFQDCGADRYGRISFEKLIRGMRQRLLALPGIESQDVASAVVRGVTLEEFRAIWRLFEDKGSVSAKDWALGLYRAELNSWPTAVDVQLRSTVRCLKLRADRIYQSPDNWYRVFCMATENSPTIVFDELLFIVRTKTPGLSLSPRELPTDRLRMLWREMDSARTGLVSHGSFIAFMRRYAAPKAHAPAKTQKDQVREARKLLADGMANVGVESLRDALESWGAEWTGYVSEWDWPHMVRQLLEYTEEQLNDDALHGVWVELDHKKNGELEAEQLLERLSMQSRIQKTLGSSTVMDLLRSGETERTASVFTPGQTPGTGVTAPPGDALGRGIATPPGEQPEAPSSRVRVQRLGTQAALARKPQGVYTLDQDPALRTVAERLAEALMGYFQKRNVHCSTTIEGWHRFFSEMDADDSGRATLEEMEDAFRRCLSQARVSRYELLMLWRRLDLDGSGEVSLDEFVLMMYRNELAMWPRSSDAELARVVKVVSAAISRRHHVEGNWYKVFLFIDPKGTGTIVFEDLQKFLRGTYPGLHLDREELPNDDMFRLWKALDTTEGMRVPKSEFMSFMRRYGGASGKSEKASKAAVRRNQPERQTKEQLTSDDTLRRVHTDSDHKNDGEVEAEQLPERESLQSRQKPGSAELRPGTESTHPPSTAASALMSTPRRTPGLTGVTAPPGDVRGIDTPTGEQSEAFDVSLSLQRLGAQSAKMRQSHGTFTPEQDPALKMVAERLAEALMAYLHKRGVHCSTTIAGWYRFFSDMDADDSGRATFEEMEDAFQRCLSHARVSRYELLMLWRRLDADGSGEVSLDEFVKMMYRYELAMWPRSSDAELRQVVKVVSAAVSRWHHVEGNWYKIYLFIDNTGTGTITFEDLEKFLRGTYPGLHLDREELPSDDMFRLWKALDTSARMRVPKSEFMSFMRRYGGASGKSEKVSKVLPKDDSKRRSECQTPQKVNTEEWGQSRTQSFMAAMRRNQRERQKKAGARLSHFALEAEEEAAQSIMDRLSHYSVEQLMFAYDGWGLPWIGVVSEWEWQLLVRRLLGFDEDYLDDTVLHSFWTCIDQQLTGYVAAGDLLQMMRIGRRSVGSSSPRQDLCSFHPPHPDAHASDKLQKQERILTEATYWRSAWWTAHLRHSQGLLPKVWRG